MAQTFNSVKIVKEGTITGDEKSIGGALDTTLTYYPFGGDSDLWGTTFTSTQINASNFGVVVSFLGSGYDINYTTHYLKASNFGFTIPDGATINGIKAEIKAKARNSGLGGYIDIDHIRITVYYTETLPVVGPFPTFLG